MDYSLCIQSLVNFIEHRVRDGVAPEMLEKITGFSYRHLREVFKERTAMTLARYELSRRLSHAAFEMAHSGKSLTDIAGEYGFEAYDTFSRAFRRETGLVPSRFRQAGCTVGRKMLAAGIYGPAILQESGKIENKHAEAEAMTKEMEKSLDGCILYGVPKVEYTFEACTPFPACLKACLNYMGQQADYATLMAVSGAAFRLRWNLDKWDGGNVDIQYVYEDPREAFRRAFEAVGRQVAMLGRKGSSKENFMAFIRKEIGSGRPVIALGVIGPPEACILTGYQDNGETLLGWNFFQGNPMFDKTGETHACGYFISRHWWENDCTRLLMAIGEEAGTPASPRELLENALQVLTQERLVGKDPVDEGVSVFAGGPAAFDAWAGAMGNDKEFPENAVLPMLYERAMCQTDAQVMVGEGRYHAAGWITKLGEDNPLIREECEAAAKHFRNEAECMMEMYRLKGGFEQSEQNVRNLAKPEVRRQIVPLIQKAKQQELAACACIREMLKKLA